MNKHQKKVKKMRAAIEGLETIKEQAVKTVNRFLSQHPEGNTYHGDTLIKFMLSMEYLIEQKAIKGIDIKSYGNYGDEYYHATITVKAINHSVLMMGDYDEARQWFTADTLSQLEDISTACDILIERTQEAIEKEILQ